MGPDKTHWSVPRAAGTPPRSNQWRVVSLLYLFPHYSEILTRSYLPRLFRVPTLSLFLLCFSTLSGVSSEGGLVVGYRKRVSTCSIVFSIATEYKALF